MKSRMLVQLQKSLLIYLGKYSNGLELACARVILLTSNLSRWIIFSLGSVITQNQVMHVRASESRALLAYSALGIEPSS